MPPQKTFTELNKILVDNGCYHAVALVGIRGFFKKEFGNPDKNDVGFYDDAIFLCYPDGFNGFNANVDPSKLDPGIATLKPGCYLYKLGTHGLSKPPEQRYEALVQAQPVTVVRGQGFPDDTGYFGINIHKGGFNTTASAGCQTILPGQWAQFIALVGVQMERYGQKVVPYLLVDG